MADCYKHLHQVDDLEKLDKWKYPWCIEDAKRYDRPMPYKHPQGAVIWVNIDEDKLCAEKNAIKMMLDAIHKVSAQ